MREEIVEESGDRGIISKKGKKEIEGLSGTEVTELANSRSDSCKRAMMHNTHGPSTSPSSIKPHFSFHFCGSFVAPNCGLSVG